MDYVYFKKINPQLELNIPELNWMNYSTPKVDFSIQNPSYGTNIYQDTIYDLVIETPSVTDSISKSITSNISLSNAIENHLGEKYNLAKRNQSGFSDCSSFVGKVLKDAGINVFNGLPTAAAMYNSNKLKSVSKAKPGDLIFFRGTDRRGKNYVSHVGIVAEVDDNGNPTKMAHASARQFKKSVIVDYNANYWNKFRPEIKRINV